MSLIQKLIRMDHIIHLTQSLTEKSRRTYKTPMRIRLATIQDQLLVVTVSEKTSMKMKFIDRRRSLLHTESNLSPTYGRRLTNLEPQIITKAQDMSRKTTEKKP